jgi:hypothetical protein
MNTRGWLPRGTVVGACLVILLFAAAGDGVADDPSKSQARVFAEPQPEKALVYFARPHNFVGMARTMFLYADDALMGTVDDDSYGFAYVEPGRHLVWTNWTMISEELEFLAGRTYYLRTAQEITLLDEGQGRQLVEQVRWHKTTTDKEKATAQRHIANRYERAKRREQKQEKAEIEEVAAAPVPEDLEGRLCIPAGTDIPVELVENISSAHSHLGESIWFRTLEDGIAEGTVYLRRGTWIEGKLRRAEKGGAGGKAGSIDIVIPALYAVDGTPLPVVGRVVTAGVDRTGAAMATTVAVGVFGAFVKGKEATAFAGDPYLVTTRADAWVGEPEAIEPPAEEAAAGGVPEERPGSAAEIAYKPASAKNLDEVVFRLPCEHAPRNLAVTAIGGLELPSPVRLSVVTGSKGGGFEARTGGWSLLRYVRFQGERTVVPVRVEGTDQDGTPLAWRVDLRVRLER